MDIYRYIQNANDIFRIMDHNENILCFRAGPRGISLFHTRVAITWKHEPRTFPNPWS